MSQSYPSTITSVEKEDFDYDCTCDANLFYQKYKDQIDRVLGRHFESASTSRFADKISASASASKRSTKTKSKRGTTTTRDESRFKSKGYSRAARPTGEERLARVSDDIERKTFRGIEAEMKRSTVTTSRSERVSDEMSLRPSQKADLDDFLQVLSRKMEVCMLGEGEEEEEPMTERGYYVFERFSEESEIPQTVEKVSTILSSIEGEGGYPCAPPFEEEYMSETMRRALEYLNKHKIADLFKYLGAQLASNKPCNPIEFLINLLESCLTYRRGYSEAPLLYMPKHIESLFNSMDPMRTGYIDVNQYHTGMFTLGIKLYNMFPEITIINGCQMVAKHIFLQEAFTRLKLQLDEMIHSDEPSTISAYTARFPSMAGESIVIKEIKK